MLKDNLKKYREAKGLTQKQLAEQIGVTQSAIGRAEIGSKALSFEVLKVVAKILDCTLDELAAD